MKFEDINKVTLRNILEARVPGGKYEVVPKRKKEASGPDNIDRIILHLEGNDSGVITKLLKLYVFLKGLIDKANAKLKPLNEKITDQALALFDIEDRIYTLVVDTISASALVARQAKEEKLTPGQEHEGRTKTNWQQVAIELSKIIEKEIIPTYEALVQAATTVAKEPPPKVDSDEEIGKKPALRVTIKDRPVKESEQMLVEDDAVTALVRKLKSTVDAWAPKCKQHIAILKSQLR